MPVTDRDPKDESDMDALPRRINLIRFTLEHYRYSLRSAFAVAASVATMMGSWGGPSLLLLSVGTAFIDLFQDRNFVREGRTLAQTIGEHRPDLGPEPSLVYALIYNLGSFFLLAFGVATQIFAPEFVNSVFSNAGAALPITLATLAWCVPGFYRKDPEEPFLYNHVVSRTFMHSDKVSIFALTAAMTVQNLAFG
jgi:hypothetical protein